MSQKEKQSAYYVLGPLLHTIFELWLWFVLIFRLLSSSKKVAIIGFPWIKISDGRYSSWSQRRPVVEIYEIKEIIRDNFFFFSHQNLCKIQLLILAFICKVGSWLKKLIGWILMAAIPTVLENYNQYEFIWTVQNSSSPIS